MTQSAGSNGDLSDQRVGFMLRVLYIAGTSYCGSTLLSFLLNAHPQIASVGEETGPARRRAGFPCSCGMPMVECPFWLQVISRMQECSFDFDPESWEVLYSIGKNRISRQFLCRSLRSNLLDGIRDKLVLCNPTWGRSLTRIDQRNVALMRVIMELTGKHVLACAAKDPTRARFLNRIPELDIKVVHLVRDPRGYVSSAMKNNNESVEAAIRTWNRSAGHVERLSRVLRPDQLMRLRYEDLCADVEGQTARLARFAGVEPMSGPIRFREVEHHIVGNRMRLSDSSEVVLNQVWRRRLSDAQVQAVQRRTQRYRKLYGYA